MQHIESELDLDASGERPRRWTRTSREAPVVGSRPQAEAGTLRFLAGGEHHTVDHIRPILDKMGNAVHHIGPSPSGALAKLVVNSLFAVQVAAIAELLGLAARAQLDENALMHALDGLPVLSVSAKGAGMSMIARSFEPMFPAALAAKDLRYAVGAGALVDAGLPIAETAARLFERAATGGMGGENLTAVAKLFR
jgi:3-hydroxyisobutyrate dehydrogenase